METHGKMKISELKENKTTRRATEILIRKEDVSMNFLNMKSLMILPMKRTAGTDCVQNYRHDSLYPAFCFHIA
jgi:hypothetical protein